MDRKFNNENFRNFYSSPNIIVVIKSRRKELVGMWKARGDRKYMKVLVIKPDGRRSLGRPERWEDNIKMVLYKKRMSVCGLDSAASET
jgi:hypothetical protein